MNKPIIEKVVLSVGLGKLSGQPNFEDKILGGVMAEIAKISGQKPKTTTAKKSIAGFKTRVGQIIGIMATLRGRRAHDFISRLVISTLPRVKDFRGIDTKNVDAMGNLNIGVKEHLAFPEINAEESAHNFGLQVTVVLSGVKSRDQALDFYRDIGVPLKK